MKKDVLIASVFIAIIVIAAVVGIIEHKNTDTKKVTSNTTTNTNAHKNNTTSTITTRNETVKVSNVSVKYVLYYEFVLNKTGNITITCVNGTYLIVLNGVLNYPPSYIENGSYTIISIEGSISFPNGTIKYFVIPAYQDIIIKNDNPTKFYIVLEGNSPALSTLYNYIEYLLKQGIDSVQVTFDLLQNDQFSYQIQGVINL
ncbi:hypothetical protein J5U23_02899 [Saccharolobus shibatae B12]|uniref:Uncharacterized protein n=1 Tax=Saccharolobus shibatae (strain ATCC 51178 / DSM 5389 / JCM 8931 / NBRC 15437 / B12) TaxID=523848 RepID=A0A8F5BRI0_SACSH|nr:hypothetical protein [Saccharolobus shibatae]QXJ27117.1 hypothetical protein J5U23_p2899 [Saccharolobus shibatae B12]QXJ30010.1 hypothetical protein J5U23_02899 [Saccharolobus shibatae B12]